MTPRVGDVPPAPKAESRTRPIPPAMILAVVALVHLAIALPALSPAPHNGGDNAGYLSLAYSVASGSGYVEAWDPALAPHTKYPPLYPALLAGAMGLGAESWITFKLLSLLLVTLSVMVCFAWVRDRRGVALATGVALVLAFSPAFLWTAGLPLVLAVGAALGLAHRWRALAGFAGVFVVSNLLWWLRSRADGGAQYVSEFWMIDPYQPDLGQAGIGDLAARVLENLQGYVLVHIPAGLSPWSGGALMALGLVLMALALVGWVGQIRIRFSWR